MVRPSHQFSCAHNGPPAQAAIKQNANAHPVKCGICHLEVSPKNPTVSCRLCGVHVHPACDVALNATKIELLIGDSNQAGCYQCLHCRPKSVVAVNSGKNLLDERVVAVEVQINRIQQQLRLRHDRNGKASDPKDNFPLRTEY